ncbi:MAG: transcriptional regulator, DeoR family [Clostridia bacterium]|jgi:DeoR/GlpR family transcriptional regulator of sugar metabolism|nr:transcriptional regulator, DeoR family [Clostridia bacterium]
MNLVINLFAIERIKIIKNYLNQNEKVEVSKLSDMLNVSEVTIRKDLEKLETEGFLTRIHGGAVLRPKNSAVSFASQDTPVREENLFVEDHLQEIALIAVEMIEDNDSIMLTNGPINLEIAKNLHSKQNLTVLTNDLLIALELSRFPHIKSISLGGDTDFQSKATFGRLTLANMSHFYISKIFIEVDGFNEHVGFSVSNIDKATLIQEAVLNATSKIIVCPADCFNKTAFFKVGPLKIAEKIITNFNLDETYKRLICNNSIELFTSINLMEGSE